MMNDSWFSTVSRQLEQKIQINSTEVYQSLYLEIQQRLKLDTSVVQVLKWIFFMVEEAFENYQTQHDTKIAQLTTGALNN